MPDVRLVALGTANPLLRASQRESYEAYVSMIPLSAEAQSLLRRVTVENQSIGYRYFAMDQPADILRDSQDELIARYQRFGVQIAVEAASKALDRAGLDPEQIDSLVVNTCTGYLCPGLTSYVAEALPLRVDVRPFELQGMGCGGAIPNLETAYNFLQAHPGSNALVIAVEICSATVYFDEAPDVLISNAIFSDGAAAAVLTNRNGSDGIRLGRFAAGLYPQDRQHLHYRTENSKLRNVLSMRVPVLGARRSKEVVDRLLAQHGLGYQDIQHWIVHPGGQKVLDAFEQALDLAPELLAPSRTILYNYGNMSSATVLFVLEEVLRDRAPQPGELGLMCSFGAGFGVYAALLEFS